LETPAYEHGARSLGDVPAVNIPGLIPVQQRLVTAVHEAGHAVVADALGVPVLSARVADLGERSENGVYGTVALNPTALAYGSRLVLLARLTIRAAGAQAAALWLEQYPRVAPEVLVAFRAEPHLYGAYDDCLSAAHACAERPEYGLTAQAGVIPAAQILLARWPVVMRVAYWLARRGHLDADELRSLMEPNEQTARRTP
jgi:hypothetical protein